MTEETVLQRGTTLVRRLILAPGEATRWHRDPLHRVTVVLRGDVLAIQFRDGRPEVRVEVTSGQVDWEEPNDAAHRAVNVGKALYEEVTVFLLEHPGDVPQPDAS